jgi:hypothetical protein
MSSFLLPLATRKQEGNIVTRDGAAQTLARLKKKKKKTKKNSLRSLSLPPEINTQAKASRSRLLGRSVDKILHSSEATGGCRVPQL